MDTDKTSANPGDPSAAAKATGDSGDQPSATEPAMPREINGPRGPEPTRYGDWEQKGRCSDF